MTREQIVEHFYSQAQLGLAEFRRLTEARDACPRWRPWKRRRIVAERTAALTLAEHSGAWVRALAEAVA